MHLQTYNPQALPTREDSCEARAQIDARPVALNLDHSLRTPAGLRRLVGSTLHHCSQTVNIYLDGKVTIRQPASNIEHLNCNILGTSHKCHTTKKPPREHRRCSRKTRQGKKLRRFCLQFHRDAPFPKLPYTHNKNGGQTH